MLSLIGIPPLPGFWAKLLLVSGLASAEQSLYLVALGVVLLATVIEANYFIRILMRMFESRKDQPIEAHPTGTLLISSVLGAGLLTSMLMLGPLSGLLHQTSIQATDVQTYINTVFPHGVSIYGVQP